jgi:hypothetical protein
MGSLMTRMIGEILMSRIKLNLKQLPVAEKLGKARTIVTALTGNASFPTPTPTLEAVTAALDALEAANAATQATRQEVKAKLSDQSFKEDVVDNVMNQLAAYVESVAGSNDRLIHSAGMDTKSGPSPSSLPGPPVGLIATIGDHDGEINLSWDKVVVAKSYVIEKSPDPPTPTSWAHLAVSLKASLTVNGLISNTRYWFRVAAVGTVGQSGWSDPATRIAP